MSGSRARAPAVRTRRARTAPSTRPARRAGTRTAPGRCRPTATATPARGSASARPLARCRRCAAQRSDHAVEQLEHRVVTQRHGFRPSRRARRELDDRLASPDRPRRRARSTRMPLATSITAATPVDGRCSLSFRRPGRAGSAERTSPRRSTPRTTPRSRRDRSAGDTPTACPASPARASAKPIHAARTRELPRRWSRRREHHDVVGLAVEQRREIRRVQSSDERAAVARLRADVRCASGYSGASTINVRLHVGADRDEPVRSRQARAVPCSFVSAHVGQSGSAHNTIASVSFAIATRNVPTRARPSASTAERPPRRARRGTRARRRPARDQLVRVALTAHSVSVQLLDRRVHGSGTTMRSTPPRRSSRGDRPPLRQRRILLVGEASSWAKLRRGRPSRRAPTCSRPLATAGRADGAPHAEAELVAFVARRRAPVRSHVVHVPGAVVPDDVDELVDINFRSSRWQPDPAPNVRAVAQISFALAPGKWNASQVTPIRPSSAASAAKASGSTASLCVGCVNGVKQMARICAAGISAELCDRAPSVPTFAMSAVRMAAAIRGDAGKDHCRDRRSAGDRQDPQPSRPTYPRPVRVRRLVESIYSKRSEEPKTACQRKPTVLLALSSSEQLAKGAFARLPTALRPSRPVQQWVFHQAEKELTSSPDPAIWLRS